MAIGGLTPLLVQDSASVLRAESVGFRLRNPADRNGDGVVTGLERQGYGQTHSPTTLLDSLRANQETEVRSAPATASPDLRDLNRDGRVDGSERRAYALTHPWTILSLDPQDGDGDGVVTEAERLAYANAHPAVAAYRPPDTAPGRLVDQYA